VKPIHWVPSDTSTTEFRIVSEAAAFMTTDILTKITRPDLPVNYLSALHVPRIAWKTGTSYGRRDAWSIGYNKRYTIAVWVGNFSGEGVPDLNGSGVATPLLFEIFNALDYNSPPDWYSPPKSVDFRLVCTESGLVPGPSCDNSVIDYFIPTISSAKRCDHMKEFMVSPNYDMSYCTDCVPTAGYKRKLYYNYEPELLSYYQSEQINVEMPPPHNPLCSRVLKEQAPVISSPLTGKSYLIDRGDKDPMLLRCLTSPEVKKVYWFVNDKFLRECVPSERVFFKPTRGVNKISCSDDLGRNSNSFVTVDWE
jgi:penicillin-binding protein 1C